MTACRASIFSSSLLPLNFSVLRGLDLLLFLERLDLFLIDIFLETSLLKKNMPTTTLVPWLTSLLAWFALSVYVGADVRGGEEQEEDEGVSSSPVVRWVCLAVGVGAAVGGFVWTTIPSWSFAAQSTLHFGILYPVLWGTLASLTGTFAEYATAFACAPLLLYPLSVAHRRGGLLRYDPDTASFVLSRASLYAALRAASRLLQDAPPLHLRPSLARLLPLAAATAETGGMLLWSSSSSYTFSSHSLQFAVYATLKSAVFVTLPVLEEAFFEKT